MKKQLLILTTTFTIVVFISCSKEKIETQQPGNFEEIATAKKPGGGSGNAQGNLNKGLDGWYRFDGNLVESTGKLPDAVLNFPGADLYTEDRKGVANSAIDFNGRYLAYIYDVPHVATMSVAFWAKYGDPLAPLSTFILSQSDGPQFMHLADQYYAYNSPTLNPLIASGPVDDHWHHFVGTIDGTNLKFYVDGNLVNSVFSPDAEPDIVTYYKVAIGNVVEKNWKGALDDLHFYSRTLTASEVQTLFNQ